MKITQLMVVSILITTASMNTPSALAEECQVSAGWPPQSFAQMRSELHPKVCAAIFG
jgi:hypothetical protein